MIDEAIKLTKDQIRPILAVTFPDYRGKKFRLEYQDKYYPENYWDGGTRSYFKILEKDEMGKIKLLEPGRIFTNPFLGKANEVFEIKKNWAIVEHCIFCGKDVGIRIYVHPTTDLFPKQIKDISEEEHDRTCSVRRIHAVPEDCKPN